MSDPEFDPSPPMPSVKLDPAPTLRHLGGLAWIALYKVIKAAIAITGGSILLRFGRQNLVHVGHRWLMRLGLDPEGKLGSLILTPLAHVGPHQVHLMVLLFFAYAVLYCVEAVGLLREKRWAEWLTVVQTLILVPVEIHEIIQKGPGPVKLLALSLSFGVVLYLVWRIHTDESNTTRHPAN